ncbi:MAG: YiiX/YebB-like N1pC/P60 family cysteine hydrolase [Bacteroidota bacterium]|nr:YiiX/YebB-like N1pC/P60 family cysteine hydrolase [Bacteroidota bacterium]
MSNDLKRWPLCCLLFFALSCHNRDDSATVTISKKDSLIESQKAIFAFAQIHKIKNFVKSGDLILRTGKDYTSELMRRLSQHDKTYSHCGIASLENDTLFVYHALGGEWNPNEKLRRDPFELFCNPFENRGFGIYRYQLNNGQKKNMIQQVHKLYSRGVKFDMQFDLASDDRMYCSEFVYKTIEKATKDSVKLSTTTIDHIKFIAIDNLFINPSCKEIKRIIFH